MDHRTRKIGLAGGVILALAIAAFVVRPSLVASAPSRWVAEIGRSTGGHDGLGEADGVIPDGMQVSVFDAEAPAVGRLDPALLDALRRAATGADAEGVGIGVNSGWRSPAYQEQLLQEAIDEYGSREAAARWVSTPETSAHVSGDAVDVGPAGAAAWLAERGAAYGLCRVYGNEPWHFELRTEAIGVGCPPPYADPTQDPRRQP